MKGPSLDATGLDEVYGAWCRRVPFDNVVKRIHLTSGSRERITNGPPVAFFESWLRHGTGGTCWPSAGGLRALLVSLGFDARRGSAAMFDNLTGRIHTHATTLVRLDGRSLWVDKRFERRPNDITSTPLGADRARIMIEEFGYSAEIVDQLPPDDPPPVEE